MPSEDWGGVLPRLTGARDAPVPPPREIVFGGMISVGVLGEDFQKRPRHGCFVAYLFDQVAGDVGNRTRAREPSSPPEPSVVEVISWVTVMNGPAFINDLETDIGAWVVP